VIKKNKKSQIKVKDTEEVFKLKTGAVTSSQVIQLAMTVDFLRGAPVSSYITLQIAQRLEPIMSTRRTPCKK
jgi:hypothetical protein